jgi:DNA-binding GntR family transcriptional regulator
MRKSGAGQAGQALRGSGDFHAWFDSALYLRTQHDRLVLSVEHRAARAPEPIELRLVSRSDGTQTHLELATNGESHERPEPATPLADRLLDVMSSVSQPLTRVELRRRLHVNNQRLGQALADLHSRGLLTRSQQGWILRSKSTNHRAAP